MLGIQTKFEALFILQLETNMFQLVGIIQLGSGMVTILLTIAYFKKGQRKIVKAQVKYIAEEEEQVVSYSDMNPLIVPKLLSKPVFVKEFFEKAAAKEEDVESNVFL